MRKTLPWIVLAVAVSAGLYAGMERQIGPFSASSPAPDPPDDVVDIDAGAIAQSDVASARPQVPPPRPPPAIPPGETHTVELIEPPKLRYGGATQTEADIAYAQAVASVGYDQVVYDSNLGHAARELAYQHSLVGRLVTHEVVEFLLRSGGAVDRTVTQGYTSTSGDGMKAVRNRLQRMLQGVPSTRLVRVGVGEAFVPGGNPSRYIAVLTSQRLIEIRPAPRAVQLGGTWTLAGVLPLGFTNASALAMRVDGQLETVPLRQDGRNFSVKVLCGWEPGEVQVSVGAVGPFGSTPLVQLAVVVGGEVPTRKQIPLPPDETHITDPESAEKVALNLLNSDRQRFGLDLLTRDPALDDVARRHSEDMRDNEFFGHVSPNTGGPGDRLATAAYRASTYAENVAHGRSLHGSESGLMKSLGHRRNILNPSFTRVGIGVAGQSKNDVIEWTLTQLFSRPVKVINPAVETARIRERINDIRRKVGAQDLRADGALDKLARRAARKAALHGTDGIPQDILDQASERGLIPRGASVSVQTTTRLDELTIPEQASQAALERVGVGVVQLESHSQGIIGVVMLFSGGRR